MWECQVSVDIDVPVEAVYRRLLDFERHADFSEGLTEVRQTTAGPIGVGSRFCAEERVPGHYRSWSEITRLEEPRLIAWKAWVEGVMRTEWEFRLSPAERGTRLVQVSRWQPAGPVGFIMLNLHRKRNAPRENARTLARVKEVLEAERAARTREVPA